MSDLAGGLARIRTEELERQPGACPVRGGKRGLPAARGSCGAAGNSGWVGGRRRPPTYSAMKCPFCQRTGAGGVWRRIVGLTCNRLRASSALLFLFDGQEDELRLAIPGIEAAGIEHHVPATDALKLVLHLKPFKYSVPGNDLLQQLSQARNIPLVIAQLIEQPPLGLLGLDIKGLVECPVSLPYPQLRVEHACLPLPGAPAFPCDGEGGREAGSGRGERCAG